MPVDDAALRTRLLLATTPAQLRQEQTRLFVGHGCDLLQSERYGLGENPELGGHRSSVTMVDMRIV